MPHPLRVLLDLLRAHRAVILWNLAVLLFCAALSEAALFWALAHPARFRGTLLEETLDKYYKTTRNIIQAMPESAAYDPDLTYRLRPGAFRFANREFDTACRVNSAGLRDEEAALSGPEVIVLGDSYAMGWGVEQGQAFPQVLARLTGKKVLNAGVSSYGTARELELLKRLDRSRLKALVIQYCDNDDDENCAYVAGGGKLAITSPEGYAAMLAEHARQKRYWPGKFLASMHIRLDRAAREMVFGPRRTTVDARRHRRAADCFLGALLASGLDFSHIRLTVVLMTEYDRMRESAFLPFLKEELARRTDLPPGVKDMAVVDVLPLLDRDDFYPLDGHLNAAGQAKAAQALAAALSRP